MPLLNPNQFDAERLTAEQKRRLGKLYSAAPELQEACEIALAWFTNVNTADPLDVVKNLMSALRASGYEESRLDDAAVAMMAGAARCGDDRRRLARHGITYEG